MPNRRSLVSIGPLRPASAGRQCFVAGPPATRIGGRSTVALRCESPAQRLRIDGGAHLGVVVEIDINVARGAARAVRRVDQLGVIRLAAAAPGTDAGRPTAAR